jgi:hypothetical protein
MKTTRLDAARRRYALALAGRLDEAEPLETEIGTPVPILEEQGDVQRLARLARAKRRHAAALAGRLDEASPVARVVRNDAEMTAYSEGGHVLCRVLYRSDADRAEDEETARRRRMDDAKARYAATLAGRA